MTFECTSTSLLCQNSSLTWRNNMNDWFQTRTSVHLSMELIRLVTSCMSKGRTWKDISGLGRSVDDLDSSCCNSIGDWVNEEDVTKERLLKIATQWVTTECQTWIWGKQGNRYLMENRILWRFWLEWFVSYFNWRFFKRKSFQNRCW